MTEVGDRLPDQVGDRSPIKPRTGFEGESQKPGRQATADVVGGETVGGRIKPLPPRGGVTEAKPLGDG